MMVTGEDMESWFRVRRVTMGNIREHKRRILILCRKELFENYCGFTNGPEGTRKTGLSPKTSKRRKWNCKKRGFSTKTEFYLTTGSKKTISKN